MTMDPTEGQQIPVELIGMYTAAELVLLTALAESVAEGIDTPEWDTIQVTNRAQFLRDAQRLARTLQAQMPAMVETAVSEAVELGTEGADGDADLNPNSEPAPEDAKYRTIKRAQSATAAGTRVLSEVNSRIPALAADLHTQVTTRVLAVPNGETGTRKQAVQQALDVLTKRGVTGFKDSAGRNWSLTTYVEMKSRTLVNQQLIDAHSDRLQARGVHLVVVSSHRNPAPQCQPFEGQILALDGEAGTRLLPSATGDGAVKVRVKATMKEARSKGFQHPNCRHAVSGYVPGASRTFTTDPDPKGYAATQKQRALERHLRDLKRQQAVAITADRKRELSAKVSDTNKALKSHLNRWDLKRRPKRERINQGYRTLSVVEN